MTSLSTATAILSSSVSPDLHVVAVRPLHGGMVNTVEEWLTDGVPEAVVAKISTIPDYQGFKDEFRTLTWYRSNTTFPVPTPYAVVTNHPAFSGTILLMERLCGHHMGEARLTRRGMESLQSQLADHLAQLHDSTRSYYGSAFDLNGPSSWIEIFAPQIEHEFGSVADRLSPRARTTISRLLSRLPELMPECRRPTLVHGDLWATNIIVDDTDPDSPRISGFIDGSAMYADVEYELAYLRVFNTADRTFFRRYCQRHQLRDEFELRCRIYWLNTMMLHVRVFGDEYLPRTEHIASCMAKLI